MQPPCPRSVEGFVRYKPLLACDEASYPTHVFKGRDNSTVKQRAGFFGAPLLQSRVIVCVFTSSPSVKSVWSR
jgi:hypothetical protein